MIAKLTDLNRVEYILPRIRFGAMATVAGDIVRMVGVGLKPAAEKKTRHSAGRNCPGTNAGSG